MQRGLQCMRSVEVESFVRAYFLLLALVALVVVAAAGCFFAAGAAFFAFEAAGCAELLTAFLFFEGAALGCVLAHVSKCCVLRVAL